MATLSIREILERLLRIGKDRESYIFEMKPADHEIFNNSDAPTDLSSTTVPYARSDLMNVKAQPRGLCFAHNGKVGPSVKCVGTFFSVDCEWTI
jgi:hypothetical protein